METIIHLSTNSLKSIFTLFNSDDEFEHLSLGDTWHPSAGFVDETILEGKKKIKDLFDFPYDFKGLVHFEGKIKRVNVWFIDTDNAKNERFEIKGNISDIRSIENRMIELNAHTPGRFTYNRIE